MPRSNEDRRLQRVESGAKRLEILLEELLERTYGANQDQQTGVHSLPQEED